MEEAFFLFLIKVLFAKKLEGHFSKYLIKFHLLVYMFENRWSTLYLLFLLFHLIDDITEHFFQQTLDRIHEMKNYHQQQQYNLILENENL